MRRFVDELHAAAASPDPASAVQSVLRRWAGSRVYLPHGNLRADSAAQAAERLIFAGVPRQDAQRILIERRGVSARTARRLAARAVAIRGQSVAGWRDTLAAPPTTEDRRP